MGSFAKGNQFNDVDINIFTNSDDLGLLGMLDSLNKYIYNRNNIMLHINLIDKDMWGDDFLKSDMFIHKNRHALLLYELKTLNCNLYGDDILSDLKFEINDLKKEVVKLALTIRHQLSKLFLSSGYQGNGVFYRKNTRYCIEYFLIYNGIKNPYFFTANRLLESYPSLSQFEDAIIFAFSKSKEINEKLFYQCYELVVHLSKYMRKDYLLYNQNEVIEYV